MFILHRNFRYFRYNIVQTKILDHLIFPCLSLFLLHLRILNYFLGELLLLLFFGRIQRDTRPVSELLLNCFGLNFLLKETFWWFVWLIGATVFAQRWAVLLQRTWVSQNQLLQSFSAVFYSHTYQFLLSEKAHFLQVRDTKIVASSWYAQFFLVYRAFQIFLTSYVGSDTLCIYSLTKSGMDQNGFCFKILKEIGSRILSLAK